MTTVLDLGGPWEVRNANEKKNDSIAANVPGCIHTDLLAAKRIPDPYDRDNELHVQWVGDAEWVYSRSFDVPADFLAHGRVLLRCEGLDTLATIRLNDRKIAETNNAFRVWEFDAKRFLKSGRNTLTITFHPIVPYALRRQKERPMPGWGSGEYNVPGARWVRKSQCNFGWDWGPKLLTCGIWRPIRLIAFDTARLTDLHIRQDHSRKGRVTLHVHATAETRGKRPLTLHVEVEKDGKTVARAQTSLKDSAADIELPLSNPQLWWPNGMGEQPLYTVRADLRSADGTPLDEWEKRIGLRTLELVREPDSGGESFHFRVNGVGFFAKGANWIPADTFVTRLTRTDYARLLGDAAAVHMNMLRVWGGGIYEYEAFYELCDELGICIWQDFMFACATYPTFDKAYMKNVEQEARDTVRRLRHHPSLALWCGNNEIEQGLMADKWDDHHMSWKDYSRLFDALLPRVVAEHDPERPYWPCSPHSPHGDRHNFNNPTCGDAHLWDVWHGRRPFEWYRTTTHRFISEFGFQSFPEPKTVHGYTRPEDRNITSRVMELHQRSWNGNSAIIDYMLSWFRLPSGFEATLWLSQILQGLAIKYAVDHWRRNRPHTMGALYWQLNDCWPVASWASIDWPGRWKALHYFARRFFAPLAVTAVEDPKTGTVDLFAASDHLKSISGVLQWTLTNTSGRTLDTGSKDVRIPTQKSLRITRLKLDKFLRDPGPRDLLLWVELESEGEVVSADFVSFARPKHLELGEPGITAKVRVGNDGRFRLTLKVKRPALWAWIELDDVDASISDNFFHLRPGRPVTITVEPTRKLSVDQFQERLRIRSLVDTYRETV